MEAEVMVSEHYVDTLIGQLRGKVEGKATRVLTQFFKSAPLTLVKQITCTSDAVHELIQVVPGGAPRTNTSGGSSHQSSDWKQRRICHSLQSKHN